MSDLPEPLTPPDCDLRGMDYMPLDIARLLDSDFYALSTPEEFRAGFTLWCRSFLQVPAGSLPNDDKILAKLSGAGGRWPRIKSAALRGFVLCQDGRLYHHVVAEKAKIAFSARLAQRARTEAARAARQANREEKPRNTNGSAPPNESVTDHVTDSVTDNVTDNVTYDIHSLSHSLSQTPSKGKVSKVKEREKERGATHLQRKAGAIAPGTALAMPVPMDEFDIFWAAYPRKEGKGNARKAFAKALQSTTLAVMLAAIRSQIAAGCLKTPKFRPHPASWLNGQRWLDTVDFLDPVARIMGFTEADQADFEPLKTWDEIKGTIQ